MERLPARSVNFGGGYVTNSSSKRGSLFGSAQEPKPALVAADPPPPPPTRASTKAPSREGKAAVTLYVDPAAAKQLKRLAVDEDTSIQTLMVEALNDLFAKRGKNRIA